MYRLENTLSYESKEQSNNLEIFQYELKNLQVQIENHEQVKSPRPVEKLKSGRILLPYDWKGQQWDFVLEKIKKGKLELWVKKR
ncbi:MAG: hypothetical protein GXP45_02365 [bacterium]|nr:hypothetical protein [bacterium]